MKLNFKSRLRHVCKRRPQPRSTTQYQTQPSCAFLQLPAEIRNDIYKLVLVTTDSISLHLNNLPQPALTTACRQIQAEALPIFTWNNTFVLNWTMSNRGILRSSTNPGTLSWTKRTSAIAFFQTIEFRSRTTAKLFSQTPLHSFMIKLPLPGEDEVLSFHHREYCPDTNTHNFSDCRYYQKTLNSSAESLNKVTTDHRAQGVAGLIEIGHAMPKVLAGRGDRVWWSVLGLTALNRIGASDKIWCSWVLLYEDSDEEEEEEEDDDVDDENREPEIARQLMEYSSTMVLSDL